MTTKSSESASLKNNDSDWQSMNSLIWYYLDEASVILALGIQSSFVFILFFWLFWQFVVNGWKAEKAGNFKIAEHCSKSYFVVLWQNHEFALFDNARRISIWFPVFCFHLHFPFPFDEKNWTFLFSRRILVRLRGRQQILAKIRSVQKELVNFRLSWKIVQLLKRKAFWHGDLKRLKRKVKAKEK